MKKIVLASASPRRKNILKSLGLEFTVEPVNFDEEAVEADTPIEKCIKIARGKAQEALKKNYSGFIIAADTLIFKDTVIFGKPKNKTEAEEMLKFYSNTYHNVITAISCIDVLSGKIYEETSITKVYFKDLTDEEINGYIKTNEWQDAAGGYKIQEKASLLINKIDGSFSGVEGLPIHILYKILTSAGFDLL